MMPTPEQLVEPTVWMLMDGDDWEFNAINEFSCGRTGGVPLYRSPPLPRDVLMGLAHEVRKTMIEVAYNSNTPHGTITGEMAMVDLDTIVDRHISIESEDITSKVQPEPVKDTRALCMLVAEAAYRCATGRGAVQSDMLRQIVDDVLMSVSHDWIPLPPPPGDN